jgi:hypothetical protein
MMRCLSLGYISDYHSSVEFNYEIRERDSSDGITRRDRVGTRSDSECV